MDETKYDDFGVKECSNRGERVRNELHARFNPYTEGLRWFVAIISHISAIFWSIFTLPATYILYM